MSKVYLGHMEAPCILYDLDGYYSGIRAQLARMARAGLSDPEGQKKISFAESLEDIRAILSRTAAIRPEFTIFSSLYKKETTP